MAKQPAAQLGGERDDRCDAPQSVNHAGDGREQLDHEAAEGAQPGGQQAFAQRDRHAKPQWRSHREGQQGGEQGAVDQRQGAVVVGDRVPLPAPQETGSKMDPSGPRAPRHHAGDGHEEQHRGRGAGGDKALEKTRPAEQRSEPSPGCRRRRPRQVRLEPWRRFGREHRSGRRPGVSGDFRAPQGRDPRQPAAAGCTRAPR